MILAQTSFQTPPFPSFDDKSLTHSLRTSKVFFKKKYETKTMISDQTSFQTLPFLSKTK
jgi:hypothetical protein